MKTYVDRFKSGKIMHYLRPCQIIAGKWAIETKNFKGKSYIANINFPLFETLEAAETFLSGMVVAGEIEELPEDLQ